MIPRRRALAALGAIALAPGRALAQPRDALRRIGWLSPGSPQTHGFQLAALLRGLGELGWVSGRNLLVVERWAQGRLPEVPALTRQLVDERVSLIVVASTPVAIAAHKVTRAIPIVMGTGADPVRYGLATSLGRPGGNVTGLTNMNETLVRKTAALLREALPQARRVVVLSNPDNENSAGFIREVEEGTRGSWDLVPIEARDRLQLPAFESALAREGVDCVIVLPDPVLLAMRGEIVAAIERTRRPAIFAFAEFVRAGGLMSYGVDLKESFRRAAAYVDRILKGAKPGDLPIEQPTTFELVVNLAAARRLGVTLPRAVLLRADEVIE